MRLLVVSTQPWTVAARLAMALRDSGCVVEAASPRGSLLARCAAPTRQHLLRPWSMGADLARALRAARPDRAIPADDRAAALLRALHAEADLSALIEASLGDPSGYAVAAAKSAQMALAARLGLPMPATRPVESLAALQAALAEGGLPRVLKTDGSWGGAGVQVLRAMSDAAPAFARATTAPSLLQSLKLAAWEGSLNPVFARRDWQPGMPDLQDFVDGHPANRAVIAERGRVLAGLSVEVLQAASPTAPATVIRVVEDAEMTASAAAMTEALGLSGFLGFDFVVEPGTGRKLLIEMNPRATPICHLGGGLAAAYAAHLKGEDAAAIPPPGTEVALFPGEWLRDPHSPHLHGAWHDVPWTDPGLLRAYLDDAAALDRFARRQRLFRRLTGRA
ncbi:hypothetical protein KTR66_18430 [Roseococcus sp. SDR]|uniref:hypothetical protein n=1 Tax=Roseococcus sp. SDR TaxID=2835532 RepID=UPI001BD04567|nr:hypothetical protein [Roseococcus sp. SDR]MBS7791983.1 hypothetical protein [Roseococcus sp. SDR]MBV1847297.1 hypothetical protein [Roseococcus sp. SDR]